MVTEISTAVLPPAVTWLSIGSPPGFGASSEKATNLETPELFLPIKDIVGSSSRTHSRD